MSYVSANIHTEISIPSQGILSRTLYKDEFVKVIIFGFSAGHELSAHTAPMAATLQILEGSALVILGETTHELNAGSFIYMPPSLKHAITATTPMLMLLSMWNGARS